jgi:hypothetical protein
VRTWAELCEQLGEDACRASDALAAAAAAPPLPNRVRAELAVLLRRDPVNPARRLFPLPPQ